MDPDDSVSFSKGCFVSRARKRRAKSSFSHREFFDNDERCDISEALLQDVYKSVEGIHTSAMEKLFTNLITFIKDAYRHREDYSTAIPAAALITGINMTGHFDSVSLLHETIKSSASRHVAIVHAKNSQDMKAVMKSIGWQLMYNQTDETHDNSMELHYEYESNESFHLPIKSSSPVVINDIKEWYLLETHRSKKRDEIVIVFKDTEFFPSSILQDLISMMSGVVDNLPFVLVFCLAMPWASVIDKQLPYSSICNLNLTKFYAPPSSELLAVVISDILLENNFPFKLGGKSLQLLLDQFLCNDFSLQSFLQALKFCILEHFRNEPASILCTNDRNILEARIQNMSANDLNQMRMLPSVKKHFQSVTKKQRDTLVRSNKIFRQFITESTTSLLDFHSCYYMALRSLYSLCKSLPSNDLSCSLRQLYCTCYIHPVTESVDYKRAMLLVRSCSKQQITSRLEAALNHLDGAECRQVPDNVSNQNLQNLLTVKSELKALLHKLKTDDFTTKDSHAEESTSQQPLETVKYAYQLKEEIQHRYRQKQMKGLTGFQKLRGQIVDQLDAFFKQTLHSPNTFPLHEIFYFESTSSLRSHVLATPRLSVQSALSAPSHISNLEGFGSSDEEIPNGTPDVCIAYKLHRECSRIINLYDWLEAFNMIVTSGQDSGITEETQARFTRAVSELQFLGLIKPTKRKTDHVERLTW